MSALCGATSASAQTAAVSAPVAMQSSAKALGDRGGDVGAFSGYRFSAPLRLSLETSILPKAGGFPNCVSREEAAGNSVGGIPVQHYRDWRLTPRLVLSGFTQLGCPIDAGLGAVLTYAIPLRQSLQIVFGAGVYAAPGQLPLFAGPQASFLQYLGSVGALAVQGLRADSPVNGAARLDLVWTAKDGRPYNVGVESLGIGKQTIKFGGGF